MNIYNNIGNTIIIPHKVDTTVSTFLSRDSNIQGNTYLVENPTNFEINQRYLIGSVGTSNAEINTITAIQQATTTLNPSVTFSTALVNKHYRGDIIARMVYDQIELYADNVLTATFNIQVSDKNTFYQHSTGTLNTVYKFRYKNSINSTFSEYQTLDREYEVGTAGAIIEDVLSSTGSSYDSVITPKFMIDRLNDARELVHSELTFGEPKDYLSVFNYPIKVLAGTNFVNLPTDIDFKMSNRSLFRVRFASFQNTRPLSYIDKSDWNVSAYNLIFSNVVSSTSSAIVLENTGNFPNSGAILVQANNYSTNPVTINYTANNRTTNTLTVSSAPILTAGIQVSNIINNSIPSNFTVYDGKIIFDRFIPRELNGTNIIIDYYKKLTPATVTTLLPENYSSAYKHYLKFAIKKRRDDRLGTDDEDYKIFINSIKTAFSNNHLGQSIRII